MRSPSKPDALENKPVASGSVLPSVERPVSRDPSYPDRARIDSDVRAFLRPVSTPWIVFDRDSRVDPSANPMDGFARSALRAGAMFASNPSFHPEAIQAAAESGKSVEVVDAQRDDAFRAGAYIASPTSSVLTDVGIFPHSSPESVVEPSSLVVASDVMRDSSSAIALDDGREIATTDALLPPTVVPRPSRRALILGACGVLALAGVTIALAAGGTPSHDVAALKGHEMPTAAAAAIVAPPPAETVAAAAPAPDREPSTATTTKTESAAAKVPTDPKKRFGKLTIKADAKRKNVWFDGKRMLGSGQRSFLVFCGMHTIAVSDKADTKDIEVPCNGEFVVGK
jgi:hypothetical protein